MLPENVKKFQNSRVKLTRNSFPFYIMGGRRFWTFRFGEPSNAPQLAERAEILRKPRFYNFKSNETKKLKIRPSWTYLGLRKGAWFLRKAWKNWKSVDVIMRNWQKSVLNCYKWRNPFFCPFLIITSMDFQFLGLVGSKIWYSSYFEIFGSYGHFWPHLWAKNNENRAFRENRAPVQRPK